MGKKLLSTIPLLDFDPKMTKRTSIRQLVVQSIHIHFFGLGIQAIENTVIATATTATSLLLPGTTICRTS